MQRFHFHLRADGTLTPDEGGTELPDVTAARSHAVDVARELMRDTDDVSRLWSLRVEHENGQHAFDLFFADVDTRLLSHSEDRRALAAETCRRLSALTDARCAVRATLVEARMLLARARGRPQLVVRQGQVAT